MQFGYTWIGAIGTGSDDDFTVDAARLLRYLLLFDRIIIQSSRLREFGVLARTLGCRGLSALLKSGAVRIHCHALTTAQTGQSNVGGRTTPLPLGSYSFRSVRDANRKNYLHRCFQNVTPGSGLTYKECKRLKRDIANRLVDPIDTVRQEMDAQFQTDLRSSARHFCTALSMELKRNYEIPVKPKDLSLRIHEVSEGDFHVESNLNLLTTLDDVARHKATEHALLAVSGLNQRLAEMDGYSALTDLWYRDLPVLGSKLRYFLNSLRKIMIVR